MKLFSKKNGRFISNFYVFMFQMDGSTYVLLLNPNIQQPRFLTGFELFNYHLETFTKVIKKIYKGISTILEFLRLLFYQNSCIILLDVQKYSIELQ